MIEDSKFSFYIYKSEGNETKVAEILAVINELARASRWKVAQFQEAFRQASLKIFLVEHQQNIIGFAIFSVVVPEAHLVNIAIAPVHQGCGLGCKLLEFSLDILRRSKISECWLEVRESNSQALSFYEKFGFSKVQQRKHFYEEPREDAWLMMAKI